MSLNTIPAKLFLSDQTNIDIYKAQNPIVLAKKAPLINNYQTLQAISESSSSIQFTLNLSSNQLLDTHSVFNTTASYSIKIQGKSVALPANVLNKTAQMKKILIDLNLNQILGCKRATSNIKSVNATLGSTSISIDYEPINFCENFYKNKEFVEKYASFEAFKFDNNNQGFLFFENNNDLIAVDPDGNVTFSSPVVLGSSTSLVNQLCSSISGTRSDNYNRGNKVNQTFNTNLDKTNLRIEKIKLIDFTETTANYYNTESLYTYVIQLDIIQNIQEYLDISPFCANVFENKFENKLGFLIQNSNINLIMSQNCLVNLGVQSQSGLALKKNGGYLNEIISCSVINYALSTLTVNYISLDLSPLLNLNSLALCYPYEIKNVFDKSVSFTSDLSSTFYSNNIILSAIPDYFYVCVAPQALFSQIQGSYLPKCACPLINLFENENNFNTTYAISIQFNNVNNILSNISIFELYKKAVDHGFSGTIYEYCRSGVIRVDYSDLQLPSSLTVGSTGSFSLVVTLTVFNPKYFQMENLNTKYFYNSADPSIPIVIETNLSTPYAKIDNYYNNFILRCVICYKSFINIINGNVSSAGNAIISSADVFSANSDDIDKELMDENLIANGLGSKLKSMTKKIYDQTKSFLKSDTGKQMEHIVTTGAKDIAKIGVPALLSLIGLGVSQNEIDLILQKDPQLKDEYEKYLMEKRGGMLAGKMMNKNELKKRALMY
jgi:hypothetical protein